MRDPKTLYDLRYYARRRGYRFSKTERVVTTPEANRSARVEERLKAFGYGIQLNLFSDENNTVCVLPPLSVYSSLCKTVTPQSRKMGGGVEIALNFCNYVTCHMIW